MDDLFFQDDESSVYKDNHSDSVSSNRPVLSYNDIAHQLIKDKLWLSALELHAELIEAGKEVPKLREFFSNPGNFENQTRLDMMPSLPRSASQATLDSLDFTRLSEDGERGTDERIAVLEFELRKAKETINALRANLTEATGEGTFGGKFTQGDPIKSHEVRALNFLINEYLLTHGYKLTSITFADENENQDFEDWDDVGLNMPKPSDLLQLYRVGIRGEAEIPTSSVQVQTDLVEDYMELKNKLLLLEKEITPMVEESSSQVEIAISEPDNKEVEESESSGSFEEIHAATVDEDDDKGVISVGSSLGQGEISVGSASPVVASVTSERDSPLLKESSLDEAEHEPWIELPRLPQFEGFETLSNEELVYALSQHMPSILHNLPLNNKEWLLKMVPLLVCLFALQPEDKRRDSLLGCLLNIKKRPTQEDRSIILAGLMRACEVLSEYYIELLVLPHCWELMSHKYPERRALIAQACPYVSLYISRELRESLIISILKQLMDDKEEAVRSEAVISLAHIAGSMSRNYHQIEELTMRGLTDKSEVVVKSCLKLLCPVTARWAINSGRLRRFLAIILATLDKLIKKGDSERIVVNCLKGLSCCLPHINSESGAPNKLEAGDNVSPLLQSVTEIMVPQLLELLEKVDPNRDEIILGFVNFFTSLTTVFGSKFTTNQVKPLVEKHLEKLETSLLSGHGPQSLATIPVYILGILARQEGSEEEIGETVVRLLISVGLCGAPQLPLRLTVRTLAQQRPQTAQVLLGAVWKGVVHQTRGVKELSSRLLSELVPHLAEQLIATKVLPALVTLASDTDVSVRVSTLPVYALIIERCSSKEVVEKCYFETERLISDKSVSESVDTLVQVIIALGRMAPRLEANFREQVALKELERFCGCADCEREEVLAALVEAFSNTVYCHISKQVVLSRLLPSLRLLESRCQALVPSHTETVSGMIRELELRFPTTPNPIPRSGSAMSLGMNQTNVEEMKAKVTKMFTTPISKQANLPNLQNIFWKK